MLNIGWHNACKQKDVASALEVFELSSGCSTEVGEAAAGTVHMVCTLESLMLSHLLVDSQTHLVLTFPLRVLGTSEQVMSVTLVSERDVESSTHTSRGKVSLPAAPGLGFHREKPQKQHPKHHSCQHLAVNWC